jgi:hypothetical protein
MDLERKTANFFIDIRFPDEQSNIRFLDANFMIIHEPDKTLVEICVHVLGITLATQLHGFFLTWN